MFDKKSAADPKRKIMAGSLVRVKPGANDYHGNNLPPKTHERNHRVKSVVGDRVTITFSGITVASVKIGDLVLL